MQIITKKRPEIGDCRRPPAAKRRDRGISQETVKVLIADNAFVSANGSKKYTYS
jgi:hypothetical protein